MDEPVPRRYSNLNLYLTTCAVNLISVSVGSTMTWTSPTLPKLLEPNDRLTITAEEAARIASLLSLGACFGPLLITQIVDWIGKKSSLFLCTSLIFLHWMIIAMVNSLQAIYVARFIVGLALGIAYNVITVYVAEISPDDVRGHTGSFLQLFIYTGCFLSYVIGPYTSVLTLILVLATIPLITMVLFIWIPESPHYLLTKGRKQKAYATLHCLRTYPDDRTVIQEEINNLQKMLDKSNAEKSQDNESWIKRMTHPNMFKPIYYAFMLVIFQQMTGIGAVMSYTEIIFQKASPSMPASIAAIICGLVMFFSGIITPPMVKLFRIRTLLYFSTGGCCFSQILMGIYFKAVELGNSVEYFNWVPLFCLVIFIIAFSIGIGPYTWVILGEILHPSVKTLASGCATSLCSFLSFLITRYFGAMIDTLGSSGTFWLFGVFCLFAMIFITLQLPDTEGKSFQEIQDLIAGKKSADAEMR